MPRDKMRAFRVDDERWERARLAAEAQGISVAELIRRGIDSEVAKWERKSRAHRG